MEEYARVLNDMVVKCEFTAVAVDRFLYDILVAVSSSAILSKLITKTADLTFKETLEKAKLLESFRKDVDNIHASRQ